MPFELPPYTRLRGGKLYLNLPIPADLRPRFLTHSGKPRTHIVEALGTGDPADGRRLARLREAYWVREFDNLRKGHRGELPSDLRRAHGFREAILEARAKVDPDAEFAVASVIGDHAERIELEAGAEAAQQFYALATRPEHLTLLQALERMGDASDMTEGTKRKRAQQVADLLRFLKVTDCLPEYVTEARAVAYVDWLNQTTLGKSTKQDRLSGLQTVWRFLERKRQVPHGASPWHNHEVTSPKKVEGKAAAGEKRGWKEAEMLKLFQAPEEARAKHYRRTLFRELYVLGFITGMRLDEIVSIRPQAVEVIKGGYWINVEQSKTEAGVRGVPVVHLAAVAILKRRLKAQKQADASIFPECRPGGPDNKLSWQVQKAMGRDRDALGFGGEVDFHSTRRTFLTMMENSGADVVHVQRYVGHRVPTMMHAVYSDGASRESLRKVAAAVRYPAKVEAALKSAAGL
ncbi:MAG: tyrosine-type recombinase/integrase [Rubrivivax sp.]|nr:tyrosine-type recombinase/integrase [Rubrivivax sp.]